MKWKYQENEENFGFNRGKWGDSREHKEETRWIDEIRNFLRKSFKITHSINSKNMFLYRNAYIQTLEKDFFMMKKGQRFNIIQQRITKIPDFITFIAFFRRKTIKLRKILIFLIKSIVSNGSNNQIWVFIHQKARRSSKTSYPIDRSKIVRISINRWKVMRNSSFSLEIPKLFLGPIEEPQFQSRSHIQRKK